MCSSTSHDESIVLPPALVRALASSATASLLSHPDITECVGVGRSEDDEDGNHGGTVSQRVGRSDHEFGLVVAEVYCSFLSVSESGGCGAKNDQHAEKSDVKGESTPSRFLPSSPPSFIHVRTDERLEFFRLFTELIHATTEELMCGMGTSGWQYNDPVSRMTSDLWEFARRELASSSGDDAKEGEEEFR